MLTDVAKDKLLTVRMSEEDLARLRRLAEHYALSMSSLIRMLAKQASDALPAEAPAPKKTARKK